MNLISSNTVPIVLFLKSRNTNIRVLNSQQYVFCTCATTGGVSEYLERVIQDIVPWASRQYNLSRDPECVAFGGSSFGGICALSASMKYPHIFGR